MDQILNHGRLDARGQLQRREVSADALENGDGEEGGFQRFSPLLHKPKATVRTDPRRQLDGLSAFPLGLCRMTPNGPAVFGVQSLVRCADDEVKSSSIYMVMSHKSQPRLPREAVSEARVDNSQFGLAIPPPGKCSGWIAQMQDVDRSRQGCLMSPTQEPRGATISESRIPGLVCILRRTADRARQPRKADE